ncbi:serine hydrolase domain-containing protein [Fodinicola acaciae]|uniref:serine hydrolase domain-containing protein n=1 Tax=Fodinicola acaciae TaxID=2681555 RepID=UPI0013D27AF6|nr:serine hydrolase domain-containing protein [Fodinicola acaciae]
MLAANFISALTDIHRAGVPGVYAEVRIDGQTWCGAAGVADLDTGRPVTPDMQQRVGSITKTFTSAAVLRQDIDLDTPVSFYLPHLLSDSAITVRMLLNHTSGLAEYLPYAYPSLAELKPDSLDDNRFVHFDAVKLIEMGVNAPRVGRPGVAPGVYSNTNYLLLGQLLEQVSGMTAEQCITREVIEPAGLRHTEFPAGTQVDGSHSRMYESLFGTIDPPRDYSIYDMSWVGPAASLISTVADVNDFYAALLDGKIVDRSSLEQMRRTVKVVSQEGELIDYGLGLQKDGAYWGHDGTVWGALTLAWIRDDGKRQLSAALNLVRWKEKDAIDTALAVFRQQAMG